MADFRQTVFAVAHTNLRVAPFNNQGRTLRLVVQGNVEANALTVCFSNLAGSEPLHIGAASLALCDENGVLEPYTAVPVTVGGLAAFTLAPGEECFADQVSFPLQPGCFFALSLYYPGEERVYSGNWVSGHSLRSRHGNYTTDRVIGAPKLTNRLARVITASDITVPITSIKQIIAHSPQKNRVLACFGDSITQQGNWTAPLEKLLHKRYPGEISLCNLGISGNRLLHDASADNLGGLYGQAGVARFERDVLSIEGLSHCILAIGTNDIGQPGTPGIPEEELIEPGEYYSAMEALAQSLKQRGVKVYAATICPRTIARPYTLEREAMRKAMNHWLRRAPCFDAVLDFDAALRTADGRPGMADGCALADGLHPSAVGGMWLTRSIDLSLFA